MDRVAWLAMIIGLHRVERDGNDLACMQSCVRNGWKTKYASLMMNYNIISQHLENRIWFGIFHRFRGKESPCLLTGDSRDMGRTPGSEKSPGRGSNNPLQHSCLESSRDRGDWQAIVHGVSKSQTGLSVHTHTHTHTHILWNALYSTKPKWTK